MCPPICKVRVGINVTRKVESIDSYRMRCNTRENRSCHDKGIVTKLNFLATISQLNQLSRTDKGPSSSCLPFSPLY